MASKAAAQWELQRRHYYGRAPAPLMARPWIWGPWHQAPRFATRQDAVRYAITEEHYPEPVDTWDDAFVQRHWRKDSRFRGWRVQRVREDQRCVAVD